MNSYKKITTGFVIQEYVKRGDRYVCISQNFVAGDQVDYEDNLGDPVIVDTTIEAYMPFEMVPPNSILDSEAGEKEAHIGAVRIIYSYEDEFDGEMDDTSEKHIKQAINDGYESGELFSADPENPEMCHRGWWRIA